MKILLVEDEFTSRRILNSYLSPFGKVNIAVNGNEALIVVKKPLKIINHTLPLLSISPIN